MSVQLDYAMYSARKRDEAMEASLQQVLHARYGLVSVESREALHGFYGEIWEAARGNERFIIKLDRSPKHQSILHRNLPVLPHLWKHGLRCIPQVLKTHDDALSIPFMGGTLVVFSHVPGYAMREDQHSLLFDCLAKVYDVPVSTNLWHETFDFHIEREVALYITALSTFPHEAARSLAAFFRTKIPQISRYASRLQYFSFRCARDRGNFVITHGDPRRNTLVSDGKAALIDWDDPLYAPPERDAWLFLDRREELHLFEEAMADYNQPYQLRSERLAFYCYYMFFQYLRESLACFFDMQGEIGPWVVEGTVRGFFSHPFMEALYIVADWL